MSNVVKFSINGDTNAEQVADRAKKAVSGFDKQVEGIGNKFKNSFKDIFLSFLGPMALLTGAIALISKLIEDGQKKREEANQAAIDGTNKLMSAEDRYWARKQAREKKDKEDVEQAKTERTNVTEEFLSSQDPRALSIRRREEERLREIAALQGGAVTPYGLARDPKIQAEVQALLAEDAKRNPVASDLQDSQFRGPQGFSNVIGVGANPVMENMTRQTDIQSQILEILKNSQTDSNPSTGVDFTKKTK
jgi:hypothetical protein